MTAAGAAISGVQQASVPIFDGVFFAMIPCDDIDEHYEEELKQILVSNGATHLSLDSSDIRHLTHLVSTHTDFEAYHDAIEGFIHVVKPDWVHQSVQRRRTINPRQYSPDPHFFFSEVNVACAEDICESDRDAIMGGVMAMGGQFSHVLTKLVTHVVALSTEPPMVKIVRDKKLKCKVVLPHWFNHCLNLGKRIQDTPYQLPHTLVHAARIEPPTVDNAVDLQGASQLRPDDLPSLCTPPDSPSRERRGLRIFRAKKIMLHDDLGLNEHLKESLANIIIRSGGEIVGGLADATVLICQYRGSRDFVAASRAGMEVGNLNWLYYLINRNKWTASTKRLLHYPFPRDGIPGFENLSISISNYQGEARIYLEALINAAGAKYSKVMHQGISHLVAAHLQGEKAVAALEWNVERVNHIWLEESYAMEALQPLTKPRYTTFPESVNLGEVVGQTQIDRHAVEDKYFPRVEENEEQSDDDRPLDVDERITVKTAAPKPKKRQWKTPVERLCHLENDELTPGARGAKGRAVAKLQAMAPDIALFQKETKRAGGVVYGGRRVSDPDRIILGERSSNGRKRSEEFEGSESSTTPTKTKKQKMSDPVAEAADVWPVITVLATGFENLSEIRDQLRKLNIRFTDNPLKKFDVLASPLVQRTRKFLCGLAIAPIVAGADWLLEMGKQGRRLPPEDYALADAAESEKVRNKNENVNLEQCLTRARRNKACGGLLRGWKIFCTEDVPGGFSVYQDIVAANGGTLLLFKGRDTQVEPWLDLDNDDRADDGEDGSGEHPLHLVTHVKNRTLWPKFEAMAVRQSFRPRLCTTDWLCEMALEQRVPAESKWKLHWTPASHVPRPPAR